MPGELSRRVPVLASASAAYGFLLHNLAPLVRILFLPLVAFAAALYFSIAAYLSELVQFIASGDPHAASVALAALTAGIMLTTFCGAVGVSSVVDVALGRASRKTIFQFRTGRQTWRLYAAYLRFLLVIAGFLSADYLFSALLLPLLTSSPAWRIGTGTALAIGGVVVLVAWLGFPVAAIVARTEGTVLRKALHQGWRAVLQNCAVVLLLAGPALLIEILSEYLVRLGTMSPRVLVNIPLANYARALEHGLPRFVLVATIATFVTIALFASGSVFHYQGRRFAGAEPKPVEQPAPNLDSAPV
jgi:hypothetical protein